jgi:hypothetical protein
VDLLDKITLHSMFFGVIIWFFLKFILCKHIVIYLDYVASNGCMPVNSEFDKV